MAMVQLSYNDDHTITVIPAGEHITIDGISLNYSLSGGGSNMISSSSGTLTFNPETLTMERGSTASIVVMYTNNDQSENVYIEYEESEHYSVTIE